jgi:glycosyltransferase involved in cell wall biosynthesis
MKYTISKILPKGSKRRASIKRLARRIGIEVRDPYSRDPYFRWQKDDKDKIQLFNNYKHKHSPLISVVVPAFNTPKRYLKPLVESVVAQNYANWELIIVDASSDDNASSNILEAQNIDTRIRVIKVDNGGISKNTNTGVKAASGEYIAFIDHDDVIEHDALSEVVRAINSEPDAGLIYTDEDKISDDGKRYLEPHFKPDWSPHLLAHVNYITHLMVVKKTLIKKVGYLNPDRDGAQDYDLALKISDLGVPIVHIPKLLYHWRIAIGSTASDISNKPYVLNAGTKALKDHFERRGIDATIKAKKNMPGFYSARYNEAEAPTIVILPFAGRILLEKYLDALYKISDLSKNKIIAPFPYGKSNKVRTITYKNQKDYLDKAIGLSTKHLILINDFTFPRSKEWAAKLTGLLNDKRVHAVSPAIIANDNTILDMGIVNQGLEKKLLFKNFQYGESTPFGNTSWPRNVDELTGGVIAIRKKDIAEHLKVRPNIYKNISNYSSLKSNNQFNVVWSDIVSMHAKIPQKRAEQNSKYFNPNIHEYYRVLHLHPTNQQLIDTLEYIDQKGAIDD